MMFEYHKIVLWNIEMLMLFHYIRIYKPHKAYLITSPITRNEQKIYFIMVTFIDIFCTFVKRHHHIYRWFDVLLEKNPMYHFLYQQMYI